MNQDRLRELKYMPYDEYLKTPEWAEKREQVLERDGYRCMLCNTSENLHVHHRSYTRRGYEELEDLVTLCKEDHEHFHQRMRKTDAMSIHRKYNPPAEEKSQEQKMKEDRRNWENYLIGLLIHNPHLCLHVCGILSESDFSHEETRELYNVLNAVDQRDFSSTEVLNLEQLIPEQLQEAANRARKRADSKTTKDGAGLVREVVLGASRLKRMALLENLTEVKHKIQEAAEAGDRQLYSKLLQEMSLLNRQLAVLGAANHLQG